MQLASSQTKCHPARTWQQGYLAMLPLILDHLRFAFRLLNRDARAELIQEGVVNSLVAYRRLYERDKQDLAYPSVLARYAIAQIRAGRRVGSRLNIRDVTSPFCQKQKGVCVERLDHYDEHEECWREILIEDRTAGPAEIATMRIDFEDWMKSLPARDRRIARKLAAGESTIIVAKLFRLSAARISQLRRELLEKWLAFQGETPQLAVGAA